MNWVGGSRNRLVMRSDAKKQREFFEKRKLQQRLRKIGVALPPSSSKDISSGSMDLMSLFIVGQIATKKGNQDPPKVAVLGSFDGSSKHRRTESIVLPMSPCSPSQLNLVESSSQFGFPETRKRQNINPQKFKCRKLSPVLESTFSDNSASDYLPLITGPLSPTSSVSMSQGIFPSQMKIQKQNQSQLQLFPHYSPSSQNTPVLQQTQFQPFSQQISLTDPVPWSSTSNPPFFHVETPTAVPTLFGSQNLEKTEGSNIDRSAATFFFNQQENTELDFSLDRSQTGNLLEDDVFGGFGDDEYETEAFNFGNPKSKISLRDETFVRSATPQTVTNVLSGVELSNCADLNSSCPDQNTELLSSCENLPSCSCKEGYLSSDSSDDKSCCEECLQDSAFNTDEPCCDDSNSQRTPKSSKSLTSFARLDMNSGKDQKTEGKVISPNKTSGVQGQQMAPSSSSHILEPTQISELCKCKKTPTEAQDVGIQTVPQTRNASTQCSFVTNSEARASCSLYDMSEKQPAPQQQTASLQTTRRGSWPPWNEFSVNNRPKVILQRPTHPLQVIFSPRGSENRDETEDDENSRQIKEASDGREEVTSAGRVQ
ncbi:uncharacterized protein [Nothobranchius furzeri]